MKNMTLEHLADICHGTYIGSEADKKKEIAGAVIDSRLVEKDYLFIAVRGEKVDGHSFIPSVFEKGALAVLSEKKLEHPAGAYILVESTLTAMKEIAEKNIVKNIIFLKKTELLWKELSLAIIKGLDS